jgi:hypothetical protein
MFLMYKTSIKIMDECFNLSLNFYQYIFFPPSFNQLELYETQFSYI